MNYIHFKGKEYAVPGEWNELTGGQLIRVVTLLRNGLSRERGRVDLFRAISGLSWWKMSQITGIFRYKWLDLVMDIDRLPKRMLKYLDRSARMAEAVEACTSFILDAENISLTAQLIPVYKNYHGPSSELGNVRMSEFCFTEAFFLSYVNTEDVSYLNKLIAVLYRPMRADYDHHANPDGDHREVFNPNNIEHEVQIVGKWPIEVREAIALFYRGCRDKKRIDNPRVFEGGDSDDESLHGLWSLMRMIAKAGHFGIFDNVERQYIDTIMMEMNEVIVEAEKKSQPVPINEF